MLTAEDVDTIKQIYAIFSIFPFSHSQFFLYQAIAQ